jgi:putative sterol carrier protein
MATIDEVRDSLTSFAESCNDNAQLRVMNKDWNKTIEIHATDLSADYTVITNNGEVTAQDGKPATADMIIQANSEVLTQVFYGEVSPNEPYNEGTLRVQGTEQDILHLDFITAMLWG